MASEPDRRRLDGQHGVSEIPRVKIAIRDFVKLKVYSCYLL